MTMNKRLVILLLTLMVCFLGLLHISQTYDSPRESSDRSRGSEIDRFTLERNERKEMVRQVCDQHRQELSWGSSDLEAQLRRRYIWDLSHRLVFCPISKVASTSWILNFLSMAGVTEDNLPAVLSRRTEVTGGEKNWAGEAGGRGIHSLAYHLYPAPQLPTLESLNQLQQNLTGFMVVRHPFVRLVSAYEDKMLNPHPYPYEYHHKIQESIKRKRIKKQTITFPKELLESKPYKSLLRKKKITLSQLSEQPSFSEFTDWVISDRLNKDSSYSSWRHDIAWIPFHAMCPVCQNNFDILKLDSDINEIQLFIKEHSLPINSSARIHTKGGERNSAKKVENYFSALTSEQVRKLADIYKYDLQMFGYDYQHYLKLSN